MRVLFAGAYRWFWYEDACVRALQELGHEVKRFAWDRYFDGVSGRIQRRLLVGPAVSSLNEDLIQLAVQFDPEVVLIWRGRPVRPSTLRILRHRTDALLVSRNNDDPFSPRARWSTWRLFRAAIPAYDLHLVYRPRNVSDYLEAGASRAQLLLPFYIPEVHRPIALSKEERHEFGCEAVFVGHFEPDGRIECLRALVDAGVDVKLWGQDTWGPQQLGDLWETLGPVRPVYGENYARALAGAEVCLCFLSSLNRDTYTRRCFEIPACGRPLVSQRSAELERLFVEGKEAVFFEGAEELVDTVQALLADPGRRRAMGQAGRARVQEDGHDVSSRMEELVHACQQMKL